MKKNYVVYGAVFVICLFQNCTGEMRGIGNAQSQYLESNPTLSSTGAFSTLEDNRLIGNAAKYSDPESRISYKVVVDPKLGKLNSFNLKTADFEYIPLANANGRDNFEIVAIVDGNVSSRRHFIDIDIQPVNDAPTVSGLTGSVEEDKSYSGTLTGSDLENSALTFSVSRPPTKGRVDLMPDGKYTYTPFLNASGADNFGFKAKDEELSSEEASVAVSITPVNDLPVASNSNLNTNEDAPVNATLMAQDPDGDSLAYEIVTPPSKGAIVLTATTGAYRYSPNLNSIGADTFTFRARDAAGFSNVATVTISLNNVNDVPVAQNLNLNIAEDMAVTSSLRATDIDGDALTYRISANPQRGVIQNFNAVTGSFSYVPNLNFNGNDSFQFVARDGSADSAAATVSIAVTPVNDAPTANAVSISVNEGENKQGAFSGSDIDGDTLNYSIVTQPARGTVTVNGSQFTYTPNAGFAGSDVFSYKANDGRVDSNTVSVSVMVIAKGTAILSWDPNIESDLREYKVYYGTSPTNLNMTVSNLGLTATPNAPSVTVPGLNRGTTYYFAVTATNAIGESSFSNVVSKVP